MTRTVEFAVADVETTGFSPQRDRVVEVAVIRVDQEGNELSEYCSLLNPDRDLGASHIHGIYAKDVQGAPTFAEIAGDVAHLLRGAVFVAHNASFDWRFIDAEFKHAGLTIPASPRLCTMQVAKCLLPNISSRKLGAVCAQLGITLVGAHGAMNDARATAELFRKYLRSPAGGIGSLLSLADRIDQSCNEFPWPTISPSGRRLMRSAQDTKTREAPSFLERLVSTLPAIGDITPPMEEYMGLLDRVLEDRCMTSLEADELCTYAMRLGLLREQAQSGHEHYLSDIVAVAARDGELSSEESRDICAVADLLGITRSRLEVLTNRFLVRIGSDGGTQSETSRLKGKSICFTGALSRVINGERVTRSQVEAMARKRGMIVKPSVIRELDFLVVADPNSMTGKAKQARDYGVRILVESVFWGMFGI